MKIKTAIGNVSPLDPTTLSRSHFNTNQAENYLNFSYDPAKELNGKVICVKGKVMEIGEISGMYVENDKAIQFYEEKE